MDPLIRRRVGIDKALLKQVEFARKVGRVRDDETPALDLELPGAL